MQELEQRIAALEAECDKLKLDCLRLAHSEAALTAERDAALEDAARLRERVEFAQWWCTERLGVGEDAERWVLGHILEQLRAALAGGGD